MSEKHTPGPWHFFGTYADYEVRTPSGTLVAVIRDPQDGRLIASAPDLAAEVERLRAELDLRRKSGSAVDRLHNLCDAIAESADGSAWSREEWERIDAENAELHRKVEALRTMVQESAVLFRRYETLHRDKGTDDSLRKAAVNAEIAARCEAALATTEQKGGA